MTAASRRVRFTADFNYLPRPQVTVAYKAGTIAYVRRECAELAIAAGKAEAVSIATPPPGLAATIAARRGTLRGDGG